ncbi:MOSC and FAD-binding oxidoreductase domain-containing protein [Azospirillum canadense]|uniref:MOSC and FAD-binding oxidoreductase domain-containing protein n=1 Tax=Azospirillum canadense TaxID=403962 RepID=UPI002226E94E|nr:MOSC and FAD-binding oxidoreductase domain-containing protein [Azospirillum canadense]MCW2241673.1 MOSC domain-containing protein YiiM/ferredoxin-NADP reductase [Azospirillum canadense]
MARLLSVNVGLPRDIAWQGRTVHTAVWKTPVQGRRMVRRLNIDGDGQGDLKGHGGEHRAVFVYQIGSYRYWQSQLGRGDFGYGQFGENFTVDGLPDDEVCIGDRYRIGTAVFEVTQPRVTCYRVGIRMNEPRMPALLVAHGRPGFYLRVLEEGEVEAGDEIVQVAADPERMTVSEINALLYKPGHPGNQLERALRIPALSAGWRGSLQALLERAQGGGTATGNPGLAPSAGPPPAWAGFRPLRVSRKTSESSRVTSLTLEPTDGRPLALALPGQFVLLRLRPAPDAPVLLRSYSLSGEPSDARYRVSIQRAVHGAAGSYIESQVRVGDVLDVSAPRGSFTLTSGDGPVVLLSAGIGATPVLAMLHSLAAAASPRTIWWIYGARDGREHPFAGETRTLLAALPGSHSHVRYSLPRPADRPVLDYDAAGRLTVQVLQELGVPRDADFYLCGPAAFLTDFTTGLQAWGVAASRVHSEIFGSAPSMTPGVAAARHVPPHLPVGPAGTGPLVSFARSNLSVPWNPAFNSLLELAEACDVPVRWSCRSGVCHNCETGLVTGTVGYLPDPVEPPGDGNVLICCCQPKGDIALDL